MPLNIKGQLADELARKLAKETGETLTAAVARALQERLDRVRLHRRRGTAVDRIVSAAWRLPRLDRRTADEVLGYDEHGLPH